MHCLPAFQNTETSVGGEMKESFGLDAMEVIEAMFESPASVVFDQAENQLFSIKAVLVATLRRRRGISGIGRLVDALALLEAGTRVSDDA